MVDVVITFKMSTDPNEVKQKIMSQFDIKNFYKKYAAEFYFLIQLTH